ncbi:protein-L-isoaspartate O-methyltransferase family protein [Salinarimonas soli]|uniref:Protein-L-isoaspartate O-methyltransferase n=1 Tax=Salinarimonas soli TaxID=1638099 RepID=A0A5B2V8R8_9HYPH|nr:protein-L-isoaspartate O-methyltransferase [Salinarimonas soli]KAA2235394.1 protein-L-isoaspartate O-methyltransferase [Salinarimonas soli]
MTDFARVRRAMVDNQLRTYDITDIEVLSAMNQVPRELFVPKGREMLAYSDQPLVVGDAGTEGPRVMLAPMVLARLLQNLQVGPGTRVLDLAGGLGYSAAVMASMGARVVALESSEALADQARQNLARLGHPDVEVVVGPLKHGAPDKAPFDVILINGTIQQRPDAVLDQLVDEGRLGCIEGPGNRASRATLYVRAGKIYSSRPLFDAAAPVLTPFRDEPGFVF